MSKNFNRSRLNKSVNNSDYRKLFLEHYYPPYCDEGWTWKSKHFPNHKGRSYKSWKHNRLTQWKI